MAAALAGGLSALVLSWLGQEQDSRSRNGARPVEDGPGRGPMGDLWLQSVSIG